MSDPSLQTTANRPLALERRRDLVATVVPFRGRQYWSIKDPVSLRYFQMREEEYFIWQQLDGQNSLNDIKRQFEERFAPQRLTLHQLQGYLGMLHREGLLVADAVGQGDELRERATRQKRSERYRWISNPLAIRLRGYDPERLLATLYPFCRWMFSWTAIIACLAVIATAISLVTVQFETLRSRLPSFESFFGFDNALWIAAAICFAKVLHELGHGLTCRHYGGECHELGVMFLVFTPCLYCNVSDAWMIPNRWHRMAISAAGMWVELVLASVCTIAWWYSEPGLLNAVCLNIMFVCSVSTVLFNGNPLLRYDGYFILADLVEIPNLRQQSVAALKRVASSFFLGLQEQEPVGLDRRRWLLIGYAIASTIYRWLVVIAILYFCRMVLKPYRMQLIADLLAVLVTGSMILIPLMQLGKLVMNPMRRRHIRWYRLACTFSVVTALIAAGLLTPLPFELTVAATIQPQGADSIYVAYPGGTLRQAVQPGQFVRQGAVIGTLENDELDLKIQRLKGKRDLQKVRLQNLQDLRFSDTKSGVDSAASQIPTAQKTLAELEERLRRHEAEKTRLQLVATKSGTILPVTIVKEQQVEDELGFWSETPLSRRNLGCYLNAGETFCLIGDRDRREALLVIDQGFVESLRIGQQVRLKLDQSPGLTLRGEITEIARTRLSNLPPELAVTSKLAAQVGPDGQAQPMETSYIARVTFRTDQQIPRLVIGATGRAKIALGKRSVLSRITRYLEQTFHFKL